MNATVRVDPELCRGSRMCEIRAGHLFTVVDAGLSVPVHAVLEARGVSTPPSMPCMGAPPARSQVTDEH
jgi:ferredoxin